MLAKQEKPRMAIRELVTITATLLLGGCSSLHTPTSSTHNDAADIPIVDLDVEVTELPGLFQVVD